MGKIFNSHIPDAHLLPLMFGTDAAALAYATFMASRGKTLSAAEFAAINTFVKKTKTDGIWSKFIAVYPLLGDASNATGYGPVSTNLVNPQNTDAAFDLDFVFTGNFTFDQYGVKGDGSVSYADTHINMAAAPFDKYSFSMGVYCNQFTHATGGSNPTDVFTGVENNSGGAGTWDECAINPYGSSGTLIKQNCLTYDSLNYSNTSSGLGFISVSRTANNLAKAYLNGEAKVTDSTTRTYNITSTGYTPYITIFGRNRSNSKQSCKSRLAFAYYSTGLSVTEMANLYSAVQALQVALGRGL